MLRLGKLEWLVESEELKYIYFRLMKFNNIATLEIKYHGDNRDLKQFIFSRH